MILLQGFFSFCQGQGKVPEFWHFLMSKPWPMIQNCFPSVMSSCFFKGLQSVLYGNYIIYARKRAGYLSFELSQVFRSLSLAVWQWKGESEKILCWLCVGTAEEICLQRSIVWWEFQYCGEVGTLQVHRLMLVLVLALWTSHSVPSSESKPMPCDNRSNILESIDILGNQDYQSTSQVCPQIAS